MSIPQNTQDTMDCKNDKRRSTVQDQQTSLKKRKAAYMGHLMRSEKCEYLQLFVEGKIEGNRKEEIVLVAGHKTEDKSEGHTDANSYRKR